MILGLLFGVFVIVLFVGVVFNKRFWQGYRNSKFLDELEEEQQSDSKELTCE